MRRRGLIPKIIKAGAGPHDLGDHDSGNDSSNSMCSQGLSSGDSDTSDVVVHNLSLVSIVLITVSVRIQRSQDDTDDFDVIAEHVFQVGAVPPKSGSSVLLASQKSNAKSVLLHHDVISDIRRLSIDMRLKWPVGLDLSKHVLVDEGGGCISTLLPFIVWLTKSLWIHSRNVPSTLVH